MSERRCGRDVLQPLGRESSCPRSACWQHRRSGNDGFTLVELLIVLVILPLVVGALALGLVSVFSLQSSVSSRLADTSDSQVVEANYQNDVASAGEVTTQFDHLTPVWASGRAAVAGTDVQ